MTDAGHTSALVQLLDEYARSAEGGGKGLSEGAKQRLPSEIAARSHAHVLIAWSGETPAALIVAFEGFSTFQCKPLLNIHDMIVSQPFRGQGLSKMMLHAAGELATRLGCCKLTLEVLEHNEIAKKAYVSAGFSGYELDPRFGRALFWEKMLPSFIKE